MQNAKIKVNVKKIFFILIGFSASLFADCKSDRRAFDEEAKLLIKLNKQLEELNQKFANCAKADFDSQTEGIIDSVKRGEAIKAAYAKRKLSKKIEDKTTDLAHVKKQLCEKCKSECPIK